MEIKSLQLQLTVPELIATPQLITSCSKGKTDRLRKDKKYLNSLQRQLTQRTDINVDKVHEQVLMEAESVLMFLKQRDMFWDQLQHK